MIEFAIHTSPDEAVRTGLKYHLNQIYIGRSSGNLRITDPELLKSHLMLEVIEKDLLIHPQPGVDHYLLNGKRATTIRKLKIGDEITIGSTVMKIYGFSYTEFISRKSLLNDKFKRLLQENSPRLHVVEQLTELSK